MNNKNKIARLSYQLAIIMFQLVVLLLLKIYFYMY